MMSLCACLCLSAYGKKGGGQEGILSCLGPHRGLELVSLRRRQHLASMHACLLEILRIAVE